MNISKFLQMPFNVFIFKHIPKNICMWYLQMLGNLYYIANRKEREIIKKNILTVFSDREKAGKIIKKTFSGIFSHYSEKLLMAYRNYDSLKREVGNTLDYSGFEHLEKAVNKGGVILVTGHFGAVEFLPLALHLKNMPVTMMLSFQNDVLKKHLEERARGRNVELIDCRDGDVITKAINALRNGRILITECDEVDAWKTGKETIKAFGCDIFLDRTLEVLCRRAKASVLCSFMVRTPSGYCLNIIPPDENENYEKGMAKLIFGTFENIVMNFPEQWYQWKKFHKMRPETA